MSNTKAFSHANSFVFYLMLANQYDKSGQPEKAETFYQRAVDMRPDYIKALMDFSQFLIEQKKYQKSLEIIELLRPHESAEYDYNFLKGKALMGLGQYPEAIEYLLEGNTIYNSDIALLNALGFCYRQTGQKEKALDAFQSSLELNDQQPEIKTMVKKIRNK
jgi:tetratricopeptide (TPR) repeat protein